MRQSPSWSSFDKLVGEQKLEEAFQTADRIRLEASGDPAREAEVTEALVHQTQLRIALHGDATAVRFLVDQPWPNTFLLRTTLELFLGEALLRYLRSYAWEVRQRPRIESSQALDLETMTADQLFGAAMSTYQRIWRARSELDQTPASSLGSYIKQGDYPAHVRGTLRDLVTYQTVALLADTTHWRPEQSSNLFQLDLPGLLGPQNADVSLDDDALHPLVRLCAVLDDLERWHTQGGRADAALEARLERLRRLHVAFTEEMDRSLIEADLRARLKTFGMQGWWSVGQATLARMRRTSGALADAQALAMEGVSAKEAELRGKQQCGAIARAIRQPDFSIHTRQYDGRQRRSVQVRYKNLRKLYFRAFAFDLESHVMAGRDYHLLPGYPDWNRVWQEDQHRRSKPTAQWSVDLAETTDFDMHQAYVTPPLSAPGLYVILVSAREDFADTDGNRICAGSVLLSDLMLLTQPGEGDIEALVLSGETGSPVEGAKVVLAKQDYNSNHAVLARGTTDASGEVRFKANANRPYGMFLIATKDNQATLHPTVYGPERERSFHAREVLLYTDRSIYRPEQTLYFKAIVFTGNTHEGTFAVSSGEPLEVSLVDTNGETVAKVDVQTNEFGSASGSFVIPSGRLLGRWTLRTASHAGTTVQVEEYKRPTFEVTLPAPTTVMRLNAPAQIEGNARYYFGTPVSGGKVVWKVERVPRLPPWWFWGGGETRPTRVASGTAEVGPDGTFCLDFTPEADPRKVRVPGISFLYDIQVEVTDEGGETRKARRRIRLGHTTVESDISLANEFALANAPLALTVKRRDLDGNPRAGHGYWRLVTVEQPREPIPGPADLPAHPKLNEKERLCLPDDDKRPRWDFSYRPEQVMATWPDGAIVGQGQMVHAEDGAAALTLPPLAAGVYRIHYETRDEQGQRHTSNKTFVSVAASTPVALPAIFEVESSCVRVGGTARAFVASGTLDQVLFVDLFYKGRRVERKLLRPGDPELLEWSIDGRMRGGFAMTMFAIRDFQLITIRRSVFVPWDDKELSFELSTFRDKLRPGSRESWRVVVKGPDGNALGPRVAEVLAYMYDRSLEVFAPHGPPNPLRWYPSHTNGRLPVGQPSSVELSRILTDRLRAAIVEPTFQAAEFATIPRYGIGGPGMRGGMYLTQAGFAAPGGMPMPMAMPPPAPMAAPAPGAASPTARLEESVAAPEPAQDGEAEAGGGVEGGKDEQESVELRSNFAETAFFLPHLVIDAEGSVAVEFDVPDSVTEWAVWFHAITRDFVSGVLRRDARTVKELMVRPYVPRFLREGDEAALRVMVNNASDQPFAGTVSIHVIDPDTQESLDAQFGLTTTEAPFEVEAGRGTTVSFALRTPHAAGTVAFRVEARAGNLSDGELRPLPVLPSRVHLAQSRFVTLRGADRRAMCFDDMAADTDPTCVHDALVVNVDAQLFYTVLKALPYLVEYPYECCEQVLNRFVSSSIVAGVYETFPSVAAMARNLPPRDTRLEAWDEEDPNRRMEAEETPWLREARGGEDPKFPIVTMLDAEVVTKHRNKSLAQLDKAQTSLGGFPWFPGGPPSPFMTLYALEGLARALEFGVSVPEKMIRKAWAYLTRHFRADIFPRLRNNELPPPSVTFLLYTLYAYRDASLTAGAFTQEERAELLEYTWASWRKQPPMLKLQLALTLHRLDRVDDARLVLDSVMDSAKTEADRGTFWAAEARSWLWYNDTTESHAFALRVLSELRPEDPRRDGLVLWLLLDKKLNQWKSTKATAAAIYALVHHMSKDGSLGVREQARVSIGADFREYTFEPDRYTGKVQWVLPKEAIGPSCATIVVEKQSPGFMFASATWHFSTESVPEARGDFFHVERRYFRRQQVGAETTLHPLEEGASIAVGDEVEIHLSIRSEHAAEYVHLRDPRPAGCEPDKATSGWRSDLGVLCYEEVRDSGINFFFEWLPKGQYTLRHAMRATMAGRFRVHPATMQSMYAPEFCAYSSGAMVVIEG